MKRILELLALVLALAAGSVGAQDFPRQPIRIIVPFAPGTAADTVARVVAEELKTLLAQPVEIEHRPGATGLVGIGRLARASRNPRANTPPAPSGRPPAHRDSNRHRSQRAVDRANWHGRAGLSDRRRP